MDEQGGGNQKYVQIHANTCIYGRKYCNTAFQYMIFTCQYPIDTGMYYVSICKYFCEHLQVFLSRYVEIDQVVFDKNTYTILTNRFTDACLQSYPSLSCRTASFSEHIEPVQEGFRRHLVRKVWSAPKAQKCFDNWLSISHHSLKRDLWIRVKLLKANLVVGSWQWPEWRNIPITVHLDPCPCKLCPR